MLRCPGPAIQWGAALDLPSVLVLAIRGARVGDAPASVTAADIDLEGVPANDEIVPGIKDPFKR